MLETGEYRTRAGWRARVHATDGAAPYRLLGTILLEDGWHAESWTEDGRHSVNSNNSDHLDLAEKIG